MPAGKIMHLSIVQIYIAADLFYYDFSSIFDKPITAFLGKTVNSAIVLYWANIFNPWEVVPPQYRLIGTQV